MKPEGLNAIVTGAGSGLGAATARRLAAAGAHVYLWDRNIDAVSALARETGGTALSCDVTDEGSVVAALAQSPEARIVVNCAGILKSARLTGRNGAADLGHFLDVVNVNLTGTYNVMRLAAAAMAALPPLEDANGDSDGSRGVIVNTASIAAYEGQAGQVAYAASKGGIVSMTLPAARDLARHGIRVMAIAPGMAGTPMMDGITDEIRQSLQESVPFPPRFARPDEFAGLALHIIENNMLNGEVIRLDGACRLAAR